MIKAKGTFRVLDKVPQIQGLEEDLNQLSDGEYEYLVVDSNKNRALPQLKYLFGVVLRTISEKSEDHLSVNALYKYFEEVFAPIHTCNISGQQFEYCDLKSETTEVINQVIDKIIDYAKAEWHIDVLSKDALKAPEAKALYSDAYADQWAGFNFKK